MAPVRALRVRAAGARRPSASDLAQPASEIWAVERDRGAGPAVVGPAHEVEIDRRDSGLDGRPKRPTDVGHDHLQPYPRQHGGRGRPKVGRPEIDDPLRIETQLEAGIA